MRKRFAIAGAAISAVLLTGAVVYAGTSTGFTGRDVRNLQDYLLRRPLGEELKGRPYDRSGDGRWDVVDLSMLKREVAADAQGTILLTVNGTALQVTLADTQAAQELAGRLAEGSVTVTLHEYGGFEQVGRLPWSLTASDVRTVTAPGDIMLYQGNQMTVFYDSNTWSYTALGRIDGVTAQTLAELFAGEDTDVTLSLP